MCGCNLARSAGPCLNFSKLMLALNLIDGGFKLGHLIGNRFFRRKRIHCPELAVNCAARLLIDQLAAIRIVLCKTANCLS